MSSIVEMSQEQRAVFAKYFYGHRMNLSQALAMAGLSYLDEEARLFVKPNLPVNAEIQDNGDVVVRVRWMRSVR